MANAVKILKLQCHISHTIYGGHVQVLRRLSSVVRQYDIVVAGGGMVGCAAACALAASSYLSSSKMLLLDAEPRKQLSNVDGIYSNRVSALSPATRAFFQELGVWDRQLESRCKPFNEMKVWDASSDAAITFAPNNAESDLAYVVENDAITAALHRGLTGKGNRIEVLAATAVSYKFPSEDEPEENLEIRTDRGDTINTKLLIAADGVNSLARKSAGIPYIEWSYRRRALVATVQLESSTSNSVAFQRFLPDGPVALLPLTDTLSSLVWTMLPQDAVSLAKIPDEDFVAKLNEAFETLRYKNSSVVATMNVIGCRGGRPPMPPKVLSVHPNSRASFPLGFGHVSDYFAPRMALIGDAAHRVHPLAGQGVNLGFGDVKELVSLLSEAANQGEQIGYKECLEEYQKRRLRSNLVMMGAVDCLHRIYAFDWMPMILLRSVGLRIIDSIPIIKEAIVARASG